MCLWNVKIANDVQCIYLYSICIQILSYCSERILDCKASFQRLVWSWTRQQLCPARLAANPAHLVLAASDIGPRGSGAQPGARHSGLFGMCSGQGLQSCWFVSLAPGRSAGAGHGGFSRLPGSESKHGHVLRDPVSAELRTAALRTHVHTACVRMESKREDRCGSWDAVAVSQHGRVALSSAGGAELGWLESSTALGEKLRADELLESTVAGCPDNAARWTRCFSLDAIPYFFKIHDISSNAEQVSEEEDWKSLGI